MAQSEKPPEKKYTDPQPLPPEEWDDALDGCWPYRPSEEDYDPNVCEPDPPIPADPNDLDFLDYALNGMRQWRDCFMYGNAGNKWRLEHYTRLAFYIHHAYWTYYGWLIQRHSNLKLFHVPLAENRDCSSRRDITRVMTWFEDVSEQRTLADYYAKIERDRIRTRGLRASKATVQTLTPKADERNNADGEPAKPDDAGDKGAKAPAGRKIESVKNGGVYSPQVSRALVSIAYTIEALTEGMLDNNDCLSFREIREPVSDLRRDISRLLKETGNSLPPSFSQDITWTLERLDKSVEAIEDSVPPTSSDLLLERQEVGPAIQKFREKVQQDLKEVRAKYCQVLKELAGRVGGNHKTEPVKEPPEAGAKGKVDLKPIAAPKLKDTEQVAYSPGFRSVHWFGTDYSFTGQQGAVVQILLEAWEKGTPDVGDATLLEKAGSESKRLKDVFKNHPAWGTMIVQGETKGTHQLAEPAKKKKKAKKAAKRK